MTRFGMSQEIIRCWNQRPSEKPGPLDSRAFFSAMAASSLASCLARCACSLLTGSSAKLGRSTRALLSGQAQPFAWLPGSWRLPLPRRAAQPAPTGARAPLSSHAPRLPGAPWSGPPRVPGVAWLPWSKPAPPRPSWPAAWQVQPLSCVRLPAWLPELLAFTRLAGSLHVRLDLQAGLVNAFARGGQGIFGNRMGQCDLV
jgi:hypothetical protein